MATTLGWGANARSRLPQATTRRASETISTDEHTRFLQLVLSPRRDNFPRTTLQLVAARCPREQGARPTVACLSLPLST